jgi:uncharacterized protein YecE (DUF72 family)
LDFYQQHFSAVEMNSTFYGIPLASTIEKWKSRSAPSFRFSLKAPREVTHEGSLNKERFNDFMERAMGLGDRLAVVLLQCPASLRVDAGQLEGIEAVVLRRGYVGRIAVEFRHADSIADEKVRAVLKRNNWACVFHPNSIGRTTVGNGAGGRSVHSGAGPPQPYALEKMDELALRVPTTADFVYVRLHGANDEHTYDYSPAELGAIAPQLHMWRKRGLTIFVFMINDLRPAKDASQSSSSPVAWASMPKNAQQLEQQVYALSGSEAPPAPKRPKKTLFNFFSKK